MNITPESESTIRVEFEPDEMRYLIRLSRAVGIPLSLFGGLSKESPFVIIRIEQLCSFAEDTMDVESIVSKFGIEKKLDKLESLPATARTILRKGVVRFISEKLPSGFFAKK